MKLLIPKKTFIAFLFWTITSISVLVIAIETTPQKYNAVIGLLFGISFLYGIVFHKFNLILEKAKSEGNKNEVF